MIRGREPQVGPFLPVPRGGIYGTNAPFAPTCSLKCPNCGTMRVPVVVPVSDDEGRHLVPHANDPRAHGLLLNTMFGNTNRAFGC